MAKLIVTVGISNSGKTTKAKELKNFVDVNRDEIRASHFTESGNIKDYKFTVAKEKQVTDISETTVRNCLDMDMDVIVSDTNLNPRDIKKWQGIANKYDAELEIMEFDVEPHICIKRSLKRDYTVPASVINKQYEKFRAYKGMRKYEGTPGKPKAILVDMDGTLALMKGKRHPFEWDKVIHDEVNKRVYDIVTMLAVVTKTEVIIVSGRNGVCYEATKEWLEREGVPYSKLLMRAAGDTRPDAEIKEEIFWRDIADNYDVVLSLDDRDQMVARWRAMGVECWQVAPGDF